MESLSVLGDPLSNVNPTPFLGLGVCVGVPA